ncbi:hypothetical protein [Streptomyces atroolivaceus]|uniref:hypothetical protein n=1 Tax=Streptomyces atroolivaceus TaxID=66869 RepID=UPI00378D079F
MGFVVMGEAAVSCRVLVWPVFHVHVAEAADVSSIVGQDRTPLVAETMVPVMMAGLLDVHRPICRLMVRVAFPGVKVTGGS